ncbi:MAG: hypothetical protein L6V93_15135 [Clostridiales bacterium]|nr:MAG: hypothetical protein L6V93_15135 [Clostridiales bacterium]
MTVKATSKKDGYTDRTALKTFEAKKRILTPTAAATNRKYNGKKTALKLKFLLQTSQTATPLRRARRVQ